MLVAFNKPYGVLTQFTDRAVPPRPTLAGFGLPRGVYAAGRLDHDSEGLLLLSDDGRLIQRITDPRWKWSKTYLVQVEGTARPEALAALRRGVVLKDGPTLPAEVRALDEPPGWLWPRDPPVRFRKTVPDCFLELTIREGRNRQVRRMTAAVGLPTLRLVRIRIGDHGLDGLAPGVWRPIALAPDERGPGPAPRVTARSSRRRRG
ncbi:MAG: pseudouridine synthase [Kofleriaceae bacterium]